MADADRILVVDDEPAICRLVTRLLTSAGHQVESVGSAEETLPLLANNAFDLYILDKNLPGMNGIDLAARVRKSDRAAGIIILTGFASRGSALAALHIGVDGYVEKPVKRDVLVDQVDTALAGARRRRSLGDRLRSARAAARSALDQLDKPETAIGFLVAHPDPDIASRLTNHLAPSGQVETVTDLATLGERLSGAAPDLLLADTGLGELTDTLRDAHARHPGLAIVVTGRAPGVRELQELIFAGVRAVVEEPLGANGLHARLLRELDTLKR